MKLVYFFVCVLCTVMSLSCGSSKTGEEQDDPSRIIRRDMIHLNALQAAGKLAQKNQDADLSSLVKAIETLKASEKNRENPNNYIISECDQLLELLEKRSSAPGAGK